MPSHEQMLNQIFVAIWRHWSTMSSEIDQLGVHREKTSKVDLETWGATNLRKLRIYIAISVQRTRLSSGFSTQSTPAASWWRHQMETFSALLALCVGNSPATGEFPTQRPVTRNFDVFFHLCPNKRLSKQSWGWWLVTRSRSLWRYCNVSWQFS